MLKERAVTALYQMLSQKVVPAMQLQDVLVHPSALNNHHSGSADGNGRRPRRPHFLSVIWVAVVLSCLGTTASIAQNTASVMLAWNASADSGVTGYNVYCGVASQTYTNMLPVGSQTNATFSGLAPATIYYFSVTAVDAQGLESPFSNEISYTAPNNSAPVLTNTPPFISGLPSQTITLNTTAGPLAFSVGDLETPSGLGVSVACSNPTLVPSGNMVLTNAGTNWSLAITPATGETGTATVTLTVCDSALCTTTNFLLTVLPLPTIVLTSPVNGAVFPATSPINLSANVNANGHTIAKVQFLDGAMLVGESTTTPYVYNWTTASSGSHSVTAQAVYETVNTVRSPAAAITVAAPPSLPAPWQFTTIGTLGISGSGVVSNGVYSLTGAGNLSGSADNFQFLFQSLSGDGEIRAQVVSAQNVGQSDFYGAMIRESLTSGSRYAFMGISPATALRWQRRGNTSGGTSTSRGGNATPPNAWVRVVRAGNNLSGYSSVDGTTWALVNSCKITMAPNIFVGLAVASGSPTTPGLGVFSNVTVVP